MLTETFTDISTRYVHQTSIAKFVEVYVMVNYFN